MHDIKYNYKILKTIHVLQEYKFEVALELETLSLQLSFGAGIAAVQHLKITRGRT